MSRKALEEITKVLTKGPVQFSGWSVVAQQAKEIADRALRGEPDEVARLRAIIVEIRESKALDYDQVQEELKPLFERALNTPPPTPEVSTHLSRALDAGLGRPKKFRGKQDNCACDEKSASVGCANRGYWHAGDPISRLKDIKEGREIGVRMTFK